MSTPRHSRTPTAQTNRLRTLLHEAQAENARLRAALGAIARPDLLPAETMAIAMRTTARNALEAKT